MPKTQQEPNLPEMVATAEVADLTGHSVTTIARWVRTGRLPYAVKLPGVRGGYLFRRSDIAGLPKKTTVA